MKYMLIVVVALLTASTAVAETWTLLKEEVRAKDGRTYLNLHRYESMKFAECKEWVAEGARPYALSDGVKIAETKVAYSTRFTRSGIVIVCQDMGKGMVLMSGPKDEIEALGLNIRKKK